MLRKSVLAALIVVSLSTLTTSVLAQSPDPQVAAADDLYRSGKMTEAEAAYKDILKTSPNLVPAQVGLVRCLLREEKVDQAHDFAKRALAAQPDSAQLMAAVGNVQFRRAEMAEAEASYQKSERTDPKTVAAYLGLARLYRSYSMYRKGYDQLQRAHEIAPDDPDVQRAWIGVLPRKQRMAAIAAYLAGPHPEDEEQEQWLRSNLAFLKATADKPIHACKLVSKVEKTDTKLDALLNGPQRFNGVGLTVKLNDHNMHLMLDTGASGILVGRKAADKAGLTRISEQRLRGIGDKGMQAGYTAVADRIQLGDLEFHDCIVDIVDRASIVDEDGLIGADVFAAYLLDIDIPAQRMRLSPLPKRPEDSGSSTSLNTDEDMVDDDKATTPDSADAGKESKAPEGAAAQSEAKLLAGTAFKHLPRDRYVAPEMANWTKVFHFGHQLLIPTLVNDDPKAMLFLIDTGSSTNILSTRAARQVTSVGTSFSKVKGLSGSVAKVYEGDHASLTFSHFRQNNLAVLTIDLDNLSKNTGTEVAGILGFTVLHMLEVKIDYRDGLVDFVHPSTPFQH